MIIFAIVLFLLISFAVVVVPIYQKNKPCVWEAFVAAIITPFWILFLTATVLFYIIYALIVVILLSIQRIFFIII